MKCSLAPHEQEFVNAYLASKGLPIGINVTFGDLALPERYSDIRSRAEVQDFSVNLTPELRLETPVISANMESVTGVRLAVALEREGGLAIIPQMLSLDERLEMLERIGRAESALIDNPLTIPPHKTLREAKCLMNKFGIYSLVVIDKKKRPIGILSTRDWKYETDDEKMVGQLMGGRRVLYVAPRDISFVEAAKILRRQRIEKLPLVDRKERLIGLLTAHGLFYKHHYPRATRDEKGRFWKVGSIGVGREFTKRHLFEVEEQVKKGIRLLLIDTARAFSVNTQEAVRRVKERFPKLPLMVGNVSTPEGAKFLFECGADIVKVGQGPGEPCRTREVGVGIPQISAIAKCAAIARLYKKAVVGDGGLKNSGDIVKALIAGADAVMLGAMLVSTEESAAQAFLNQNGIKVKIYEGSASFAAQQRRLNRSSLDRMRRPEGVAREVPVTGTVKERTEDILDGLRSAMSYFGVRSIRELCENARFELQTQAGLIEGTKKK